MAVSVKVKDDVNLKELEKYGFFFHAPYKSYLYVLNKHSANASQVEISIRIDAESKEVRLVATNDHLKLPSIYNSRYTKDNYLEFEEEIDAFSFYDEIFPYMLLRLYKDEIIYIPKVK